MNDKIEKAVGALHWLIDSSERMEQEAKQLRVEMERLKEQRDAVLVTLKQQREMIRSALEGVTTAALAGRSLPGHYGKELSEVCK